MRCRRFWISGRVQGVSFRASTQSRAVSLGLTGWVRNVVDGRVEAVACGEEKPLGDFERWLHQGPTLARVDSVVATEVDYAKYEDFEIR